jgi:hypothetical protein
VDLEISFIQAPPTTQAPHHTPRGCRIVRRLRRPISEMCQNPPPIKKKSEVGGDKLRHHTITNQETDSSHVSCVRAFVRACVRASGGVGCHVGVHRIYAPPSLSLFDLLRLSLFPFWLPRRFFSPYELSVCILLNYVTSE